MSPVATEEALGQIIGLNELQPSPLNPRKRFDDATMAELTANVAKNGVIVPLIVRGREIIDGERRYRAATLAGLSEVPVIFKNDLGDDEVIELMLRQGRSFIGVELKASYFHQAVGYLNAEDKQLGLFAEAR